MDVVAALAAIRAKGLTAEAAILEAAIDEALCDEPIVRIAGGMTADQIAEKVVAKLLEHTQVVGAKLVQKPLPKGVSPLPWSYSEYSGDIHDRDRSVVVDMTLANLGSEAEIDLHGRAIVEAVNGYYSPQTPADAAAANAETQIPDTAGYPDVN